MLSFPVALVLKLPIRLVYVGKDPTFLYIYYQYFTFDFSIGLLLLGFMLIVLCLFNGVQLFPIMNWR